MNVCRLKNKIKILNIATKPNKKLWGQKSDDSIIHRSDLSSFLISNLPPRFLRRRTPLVHLSLRQTLLLSVCSFVSSPGFTSQTDVVAPPRQAARQKSSAAWPASDSAPLRCEQITPMWLKAEAHDPDGGDSDARLFCAPVSRGN